MLRSLAIGIGHRRKGEPETRGKIEQCFDYFQRRLPFLCEKDRVQEFDAGNRSLQNEVAYYNGARVHLETEEIPTHRCAQVLTADQGWLRPLPVNVDLEDTLSLHLERTGGKEGTVPFLGQRWALGWGLQCATKRIGGMRGNLRRLY